MSFGALSTLLGQLPIFVTTITNCVLMSKMAKTFDFPSASSTGSYDFFGTSTNPYVGLDYFQPKYSDQSIQNDTGNVYSNNIGITTENPSLPDNFDRVHEDYANIEENKEINKSFYYMDNLSNLGLIPFMYNEDGSLTTASKTFIEKQNNCLKIFKDKATADKYKNETNPGEVYYRDYETIDVSSALFTLKINADNNNYREEMDKAAVQIVKQYDTNKDGIVSLKEYVSLNLKMHKAYNSKTTISKLVKDNAKEMFEKLDLNDSGTIGYEEIASYLTFLDNTDQNKRDGKIFCSEYLLNREEIRTSETFVAKGLLQRNLENLDSEST